MNLMEIVLSVLFLMTQQQKFGRAARSPAIVEISMVAFSNVGPSLGLVEMD